MSNFVVVRGTSPNQPIYIDCEECWRADSSPNRISDHCESKSEAEELADEFDATKVNGYRYPAFDCKHVAAVII